MPGNMRGEGLPAGFRTAPFECQRCLPVCRDVNAAAIPGKESVR
jgi:hypothetical protein